MISAQRRRFIVCYDVRDPKRLRKTHDLLLGYGDPLQYSVFVCDLSVAERILMEEALSRTVKLGEDTVHVIDLGPARGRAPKKVRSFGGAPLPAPQRFKVV